MMMPVVRGRVDGSGALIAADPLLYNLQRRAGASLGDAVAVPRIARLVAAAFLAKKAVQGAVVIGDDGRTIRALVDVAPDETGAHIGISDWQQGPAQSSPLSSHVKAGASQMGLSWECNASLRLVALRGGYAALPIPTDWRGRLISEVFTLHSEGDKEFPIVTARRAERPFDGQRMSVDKVDMHDFLLSAVPLRDARGCFRGYAGVAEPLFLDELSSCPAQISHREASVDFGFNMRVDEALRGPINRLINAATTLASGTEGPILKDYARYAADIADAGRHLLGLVDDLADMQSIEKPDFKIAVDDIDLGDIARRAAGLMSMRASERHISLHVPSVDVHMPALGDFRRTLQILLNLIGNAIRYSPDHSEIWISLDRQRDFALMSVIDQGPGISAGHQQIMFDKFERLGRQGGGGSGLGLYIARKLARAMGGDLLVESEFGNGSSFTLSLPYRG